MPPCALVASADPVAGGTVILEWNAGALLASVADKVELGMNLAMAALEQDARRQVGRINPGNMPSAPGEAPGTVSGRLAFNIDFEMAREEDAIRGFLGVRDDVRYALRLELGFVGVDSLGRRYDQAPRPFLRPTLLRNRARIVEIIAAGARR